MGQEKKKEFTLEKSDTIERNQRDTKKKMQDQSIQPSSFIMTDEMFREKKKM